MGKKQNIKEENQESQNHKTLEEKNLIERHTLPDGRVNVGTALLELEAKIKVLYEITHNQNVALEFLTAWFEQNAKNVIQDIEKPKIELLK